MRKSSIAIIVFLALSAVMALGLRVYKFGQIPVSTYIDETAIGLDALSIAKTGKDMHGGPWLQAIIPSYGDYKLPGYLYVSVIAAFFTQVPALVIRLPALFIGVLTPLVVGAVVYELFTVIEKKKPTNVVKAVALFSAFAVWTMPWSIHFSRVGFEGHLGQLFVSAAVYCALRAVKQPRWFIASSILTAASIYTYYSTRFVIPVILLTIFIILGLQKRLRLQHLVFGVLSSVLILVLLIPMQLSPLYKESQRFRLSAQNVMHDMPAYVEYANELQEKDGNSFFSHVVHHRYVYLVKSFGKNVLEHLSPSYIFFVGDHNLRHGTGNSGILLWASIPFFAAGLYVLAKRYWLSGFILLLWLGAALVPASVPIEVPHALRSLNALPVYAMILGIGMGELYHWLKRKKFGLVVFCFFLVLLAGNLFFYLYDYSMVYPQRSADVWADGNIQMARKVQELQQNNTSIIVAGDEKLYLWIALYSDDPVSLIQQPEQNRFMQQHLGNAYVGMEYLRDSSIAKTGTFLIGSPDVISQLIEPETVMKISGWEGKEEYVGGTMR